MKQVKITIVGIPIYVEYFSKKYDDFRSNFYSIYGWKKIEALYVDDDYENLRNSKGKNVRLPDFFNKLFDKEGEHPLPVGMRSEIFEEGIEVSYIIELANDEEFDIKKVQLLYTSGELDNKRPIVFPAYMANFILADYILYDGRKVPENGEALPDLEFSVYYDEYVMNKLTD